MKEKFYKMKQKSYLRESMSGRMYQDLTKI